MHFKCIILESFLFRCIHRRVIQYTIIDVLSDLDRYACRESSDYSYNIIDSKMSLLQIESSCSSYNGNVFK